jgi:predicted ribosomally synthesized peptide with nif11-like leader
MSQEAATEFLERVESDEEFAKELASKKDNPEAVLDEIHEAGFDVKPEEVREAFAERYGAELTPEQLEKIAAGADPGTIAGEVVGSVATLGVLVGIAAIAGGF